MTSKHDTGPVPAASPQEFQHGLRLARAMAGCADDHRQQRQRCFLIDGDLRPVRLPPELWQALDGIALIEGVMTAFIVEQVHRHNKPGAGLAAAIRSFVLAWHRYDPAILMTS